MLLKFTIGLRIAIDIHKYRPIPTHLGYHLKVISIIVLKRGLTSINTIQTFSGAYRRGLQSFQGMSNSNAAINVVKHMFNVSSQREYVDESVCRLLECLLTKWGL